MVIKTVGFIAPILRRAPRALQGSRAWCPLNSETLLRYWYDHAGGNSCPLEIRQFNLVLSNEIRKFGDGKTLQHVFSTAAIPHQQLAMKIDESVDAPCNFISI